MARPASRRCYLLRYTYPPPSLNHLPVHKRSITMPRCYMVKKQSNKYKDWAPEGPQGPPDSPTEGCVAPPYYTPLTNSTGE